MYFKLSSFALYGYEVIPVSVETDISDGLPLMDLVGYLGSEVKEARERVRTALKNNGFSLPPRRITVNISPADIRKQGTAFDLPIALSMLSCMELIPTEKLKGCCVMGELGLNGDILGITGVLPRVMKAKEMGMKSCIVPEDNLREAAIVEGIDSIGASSISQLCDHLRGTKILSPLHIDLSELLISEGTESRYDFSDMQGQQAVKRCLEIAASGFHNTLIMGPPGAGKTMAARRLPGIMPPLTADESLELTKIYSIAGKLPASGMITLRPFVSPHHTCTPQALTGGGSIPRPGSISLSHKAVLFLDELPEFKKDTLEVLRQPIEDKEVNIARAAATFTFPADFLLIAAMNPCRCGYYPDRKRCRCTEGEVRSYLSKISGPLLDRIDLCIEAPEVDYALLSRPLSSSGSGSLSGACESSANIRSRVIMARNIQLERFKNEDITLNSQMSPAQIARFCSLHPRENALLERAFRKFRLSARMYHRILRVSRTIADLAGKERIGEEHLIEALSYRLPDYTDPTA